MFVLTSRGPQDKNRQVSCLVFLVARQVSGTIALVRAKERRGTNWELVHLPTGLALAYAATKGQAQKIEGELQELFSYEDADEQCWDLLAEVTLAANCLLEQERRLWAAMATYPSLWEQARRLITDNGGIYQ